MAGITKNPELTPKVKKLVDETFHKLCRKYKSPVLQAGFEIFRNEIMFDLKYVKMNLTPEFRKKGRK